MKKVTDTGKVEGIFENWQETMIWSCLQGVMGEVYADNEENPKSAMAVLADFAFFAGEPCADLVLYEPVFGNRDFIIMVGQNEGWNHTIEKACGSRAKKVTRYAIKEEPEGFDMETLEKEIEKLPEGYTLKMIDEELFYKCQEQGWSRDLVSSFITYELYGQIGLGAVILKDNEIVSGASSYTRYEDGIEIEIDTKEEYRRRGFATICGAKLILECLKRGLYPSWDAQNKWSVALAEKLGYHYSHDYIAYEVYGE